MPSNIIIIMIVVHSHIIYGAYLGLPQSARDNNTLIISTYIIWNHWHCIHVHTYHMLFVLIQVSKRSDSELVGRTDGNMIVVFPNGEVECNGGSKVKLKPGDYAHVQVGETISLC